VQIQLINLDRTPERLAAFTSMNPHLTNVSRFPAVDGATLDLASLIRSGIIREEILTRNELVPKHIPAHYTAGAIGNALSHVALWQRAVEQAQPLTVCEDDAVAHALFVPTAERLLSTLPPDWDIILWGWNADSPILFEALPGVSWGLTYFDPVDIENGVAVYQHATLSPMAYRLREALGVVCYSVSAKGARTLREFCLPLREMSVPSVGLKGLVPNAGIDIMLLALYPKLSAYITFPPLVVTKNSLAQSTVSSRKAGAQPAAMGFPGGARP